MTGFDFLYLRVRFGSLLIFLPKVVFVIHRVVAIVPHQLLLLHHLHHLLLVHVSRGVHQSIIAIRGIVLVVDVLLGLYLEQQDVVQQHEDRPARRRYQTNEKRGPVVGDVGTESCQGFKVHIKGNVVCHQTATKRQAHGKQTEDRLLCFPLAHAFVGLPIKVDG